MRIAPYAETLRRRKITMHPLGKGAMIATAVATLALGGELTAMAQDKAKAEPVKCAGLNDCKGKNGCKGKGFMPTATSKECSDKGGKVLAEKK
jgi:uncharacterized membrane protein